MALALAACGRMAPPPFEPPPPMVTVADAVARDVPEFLDRIGKCVAREVVAIQPQVSGRITAIHFEDGAEVKANDPLFTIDPRPFRAQLEAAEATLAERMAARDLARIELARSADLVETKLISPSDHDARKNAVDVAEAQVKGSQANLETARLNLDYCSIRSPIDGRAGQRLVDLGNVVQSAMNPPSLLVVQRLDPIYADFTIAENDLTRVQRNMESGALRVEVRLPEERGEARAGRLTFLDSTVLEAGTVKLRATVPNRDRRFWPGRFVQVRLVLKTLPGAVLVPVAAPQMSARGPFVYVVKDDSTAELRPVKRGQPQGDLVVIEEGLRPGERVVTAGQVSVQPGRPVRIQADAPPGSPAAPPSTEKP
jgi:multidrug efflux system membrane fusion protein